ncbi:MAG: IclR family transcriptional regulator [Deltaproteobacteria bacterium]|nr:IclR family transcriptional regulator [Deltaproteobacteria bacterium]
MTKEVSSKSKTPTNPENKYRVTSLDKALQIFELLIDQGRDLSITEICQKLGMVKGTVHRVLSTLVARKFIQQNGKTKMYGLGVRTLEIGIDSRREKVLRVSMAPFLMQLYDTCGETVNAAVWEYNGIRYIYRLESEALLRISTAAGARFAGYCAATGKILLSYFSNEDIRQIYSLNTSLKKYTPNTITSVNELIKEIEEVRVKKVAVDDEEALVGVYCVAAPILNSKGECVAAISISAPKHRVTANTGHTLAKLVSETASRISGSLGDR